MKRMAMKRTIIITAAAVLLIAAAAAWYAAMRGDSDPGAKPAEQQVTAEKEGPAIMEVLPNAAQIGQYEKFELLVRLTASYDNPYDPAEVDLSAKFISPSGAQWPINGFYDGRDWKIRFSPNESGEWSYSLSLRDRSGQTSQEGGTFSAVASDHHGWLAVSDSNKRFLQYDDGSSFYGVGVAYPWNINETTLDRIKASGGNYVTYWNGNYDNAGSGGGNEQLESVGSGLGRYDTAKGNRLDELMDWFEQRDLIMNFVVWPHDSLADKIEWPATWSNNAYSALGEAKDFYASEAAWAYQEKLYRYMIARWGYSRSLGVWDLVVEVNGTDGWQLGDKEKANEWLTRIQQYFKANDPYNRPTSASMAGNKEDYWDHAYRTVDLSDRENYYDSRTQAYAEDIRQRWASYEKPLIIGETGNIADANTYHNAIWVSLANGLASSPVWWDIDKVDDAMFGQMKVFADFVEPIDFLEPRQPVKAEAPTVTVTMPQTAPLMADGIGIWSMPDWAPANKDSGGTPFAPEVTGAGADAAVTMPMRFATGEFSQGYVDQSGGITDWTGYDKLTFEVKAEGEGADGLLAKAVLHPGGQWTEADDSQSVELKAGEWTTVTVPLKGAPGQYWRDAVIVDDQWSAIARWGVKLYAMKTPQDAQPIKVSLRNARLAAKQPLKATKPESDAWIMLGDRESYGWLVTDSGSAAGKAFSIPQWGTQTAQVEWYDAWSGTMLKSEEARPAEDGRLSLVVPPNERPDVAFRFVRL